MEESKEESLSPLEVLEDQLNEHNKKFCHEYIKEWKKARSYMAVYPDSTYKAAAVSANALLKNPKIKQYIEFIKQDIEKEAGISKLMMINSLKSLATTNLYAIITKLNAGEELTEQEEMAISEYSEDKRELGEGGQVIQKTIKVKTPSKPEVWRDIAKSMGWNEAEKIDHSSSDGSMATVASTELKGASEETLLKLEQELEAAKQNKTD